METLWVVWGLGQLHKHYGTFTTGYPSGLCDKMAEFRMFDMVDSGMLEIEVFCVDWLSGPL